MTSADVPESIDADHLLSVVGRVLSDPQFARALETDPVATLQAEGVQLDLDQIEALNRRAQLAADAGYRQLEQELVPSTRPVVRILTHGSHPVVHVGVSVAVDTHIPHVEEARAVESPAQPPEEGRAVPPEREQPPE